MRISWKRRRSYSNNNITNKVDVDEHASMRIRIVEVYRKLVVEIDVDFKV